MILKKTILTGTKPKRLKNGAMIWHYCHVRAGAYIGKNVSIGQGCYVAETAIIKDGVRIGNNVSVWNGVVIGERSFIAPYVVFTNDNRPDIRNKFKVDNTIIGSDVTICANVTIIAPCKVGNKARIGAGSLVIRNIKDKERVKWLIK